VNSSRIIYCLFVLLVSFAVRNAGAVELTEIELVCPIGNESFTTNAVLSQDRQGQMLDFKPYGDVIAPTMLAVCPSNGLVMYQESFSPQDLEQLALLIESDKYQAARRKHTTYHLLARTFEHMGRDPLQTAFMHLQATWEVDTNRRWYLEYSGYAIEAFNKFIESTSPQFRPFVTGHLVLAELHRRRNEFDTAQAVLKKIKHHDESAKPYASRVIILLYKLIEARDAAPHAMP
jgi:hypothetical protein